MGGLLVNWRRKRLVRVHLRDDGPSLEGVLLGVERGHYRLAAGKHLESEGRTHDLAGETWVPRANVLYLQVIG